MTDSLKKKAEYGIAYGAGPAKLRAMISEERMQNTRSAAITNVVESQLDDLFVVFNDYHWTAYEVQLLADCLSIAYSPSYVDYVQVRTICHIAANVKMGNNQSQTDLDALDELRKRLYDLELPTSSHPLPILAK